jgi:hypothetical protein
LRFLNLKPGKTGTIKKAGVSMEQEEVLGMVIEFKAVLILILDLLEHGNTERAILKLREILKE